VRVEEIDAPGGSLDRWERLVAANTRQLAMVRARFEALRVEERWVHGQIDGTELDLPRVVDAVTDLAAGHTPDGRIHARFVRQRETLATLVLVDASGSTAGNVLTMETEALVLLAAGLEALRAPHAFHAFGNPDPHRLPLARIKGFDDAWDAAAHKRLGNLRAQGASRLGGYLRHAGWMLGQRPQARRVLLVLTDGRPEDRDGYRGAQGLSDTALAVQEVRRTGIHVHAVSLDPSEHADRYLQQVFGRGRYTRLASPDALPTRLPELFRTLVR
jgi:nitric oxide reductase NorD protein